MPQAFFKKRVYFRWALWSTQKLLFSLIQDYIHIDDDDIIFFAFYFLLRSIK